MHGSVSPSSLADEHLTESNFNPIEDERYKEAIARIAREVEPVTHEGGPGDV